LDDHIVPLASPELADNSREQLWISSGTLITTHPLGMDYPLQTPLATDNRAANEKHHHRKWADRFLGVSLVTWESKVLELLDYLTRLSQFCSDEGLTLETSAFNLFTVANLLYQLS